ncbi:hypothetical protein EZV61_18655 [Corallincola luteus]|uniref:HAF repeat-containing protein n=1 Tax=Corallincola luteus TaxID=1775177 RepID=A0ABY2AFT5_9GAMM|nr:hypothetical protein [Corallincola luteus]TCI01296.1 hypothetical protein EZV61_18655 [Corallincola luteus]
MIIPQRRLSWYLPLLLCLLFAAGCAERYEVIELGTLPGGSFSSARDINVNNEVVGIADTESGSIHGFLYRDNTMIDLGPLDGGLNSAALGINDRGAVVGRSQDSNGNYHPVVWRNGYIIDLYDELADGAFGEATAINNDNWIIGSVMTTAVIWKNNLEPTPLVTHFLPRAANAINQSGTVVGQDQSATRAFTWENEILTHLPQHDLSWSEALGLNDTGDVVGWIHSEPPGPVHKIAALFASTGAVRLGTLGGASSIAHDINDQQRIIGEADNADALRLPFYLNFASKVMHLLPTNDNEGAAYAINENNVIAGEIVDDSGLTKAVIWKLKAPYDYFD